MTSTGAAESESKVRTIASKELLEWCATKSSWEAAREAALTSHGIVRVVAVVEALAKFCRKRFSYDMR